MLVLCSRDGASGVVEILQQRASPLLSNVHLIFQILQKKKKKEKEITHYYLKKQYFSVNKNHMKH